MVLIKNLKIFHLFIFGPIRKENVFDNILERKKLFFTIKKQKVKKSKNWHFFKGGYSMVLVKNLKIFHLFYYWQNQPAK